MKLKHLLALAGFIVSGGSLWAQNNLIANWDGGSSTAKPTEFGWASTNTGRTWGELNGGGARLTTTYSGYTLEDGTTYSYSGTSELSSKILWIRYADNNADTYTYTFNGLEAGHKYVFSGLIGWHNNSSNPKFTLAIEGTSSYGSTYKSISTKQKLYEVSISFAVPEDETATSFKLKFTCSTGGDCMEAISALKLVENFNVYRTELSDVIALSTSVNSSLRDATLTTAISTAQAKVDDTGNNVTYSDVTTLKTAINAAIAGHSYNAAGEDLSGFIYNNGFESCNVTTENAAAGGSAAPLDIAGGWTQVNSASWSSSAVVAYGGLGQVNGASAPSADNAGNSGKTLGVSVGWGGTVTYKSKAITLPAGSYRLQANTYNASDKTQMTSKFGFVPTSGTSSLSTKTWFASSTWETDVVEFTLDAATAGCFQVGGTAISGGSGDNAKVFFDNLTLTYFDPLKLAQLQLEDLITTAQMEYAKPMIAAQKTALGTAISTAQSASTSTIEECNSAMTALQSAIDAAAPSIAVYAEIKAKVIDIQSAIINDNTNTAIVALNNGYNNGDYETVAAAIEAFKAAVGSSFATTENTVYTGAIVNPNFEADGAAVQNPLGWSVTNHGRDDGTRNGAVSDMSGWYYNAYQTWWDTGIDIKQTITGLPNGAYELAATVAGWTDCTVNLTGNDEYSWVQGQGDGTGVAISVTTYVTDGNLDIKVNWGVREGGTFFKADNFTLVYKGIKPLLQKALDEANAIDKNANVGTGAFQIPSSAVSTFTTAIEIAQGVYDNASATASEVQTAIDNLNAAIDAYKSAELAAPVAGVQYRIKSTAADDAAWKDKYYRLYPNAAQAHGGYSISADASDAAYLATAWKFTAVSGTTNGYKLSMIDADGNERYICTNIKGYEDGNATQIRTTDDASKALVVKVIAATNTDGRWYLQNTEDNSYLGGQDAGLFSNSQNYDLAIEAATQAEVTVSCKAGKYGTVIFPFTPNITADENVKFYSVTGVINGTVQLEEAPTLAANTPYMIKNEGEENYSEAVQGWGAAAADNYTVDMLTGVYTTATIAAGANNYVLQTQDGVQAFYKVASNFTATAYKCYLTYEAPAGVKALFIDGNHTDAINGIEAQSENGTIFNLAGQRVNKAQKGIYIVNGKKVIVK